MNVLRMKGRIWDANGIDMQGMNREIMDGMQMKDEKHEYATKTSMQMDHSKMDSNSNMPGMDMPKGLQRGMARLPKMSGNGPYKDGQ